jgi:predicted DNA binding CopG/RHH family protein
VQSTRKRKRASDAEVAEYWLAHDSADEIDWSKRPVKIEFDAGVERPTRSVTLRLPRRLLQELRVLAKDRDVPYQSLMKILLAEKVAELRRRKAS